VPLLQCSRGRVDCGVCSSGSSGLPKLPPLLCPVLHQAPAYCAPTAYCASLCSRLYAEISAAIKQLSVAAKVMVYALHAANPELAAACKLEVVGRVGVAAKLPTELRAFWEGHRVDVGCAAAPAAAGTTLVVSVS
jgi:hypothetical protein